MTLSDLRALAALLYSDLATDYTISDAQWDGLINDAYERWVLKTKLLRELKDIAAVADQWRYQITGLSGGGCIGVIRAWVRDADSSPTWTPCDPMPEQVGQQEVQRAVSRVVLESGMPRHFQPDGFDYINVYPIPDATFAALTTPIRVEAAYSPARMTGDGDTPEAPLPAHHALAYEACRIGHVISVPSDMQGASLPLHEVFVEMAAEYGGQSLIYQQQQPAEGGR